MGSSWKDDGLSTSRRTAGHISNKKTYLIKTITKVSIQPLPSLHNHLITLSVFHFHIWINVSKMCVDILICPTHQKGTESRVNDTCVFRVRTPSPPLECRCSMWWDHFWVNRLTDLRSFLLMIHTHSTSMSSSVDPSYYYLVWFARYHSGHKLRPSSVW